MCRKNRATYNSSMITRFVVQHTEITECMFKPSKKALFFSDVKQDVSHLLVDTVDSIK